MVTMLAQASATLEDWMPICREWLTTFWRALNHSQTSDTFEVAPPMAKAWIATQLTHSVPT
jgi:hypothetical protein